MAAPNDISGDAVEIPAGRRSRQPGRRPRRVGFTLTDEEFGELGAAAARAGLAVEVIQRLLGRPGRPGLPGTCLPAQRSDAAGPHVRQAPEQFVKSRCRIRVTAPSVDPFVGPHDDDDQIMDIYTELYRLLGVDPRDAAGRLKPPCCDETQDLPLSLEPRSPMFSIMRPRSARQDGPRKQTRPCQCAGITARKSGSLTPVR